MSQHNVKKIIFIRDVFLSWELDVASVNQAKKGAYFSEIDLTRLPSNTAIELQFDPRTGQPMHIIIKEKRGKRSVVIPAALTYQYCEASEIAIASPFQKH